MSTSARPTSLAWLGPWRTGDVVGLVILLVGGAAMLTAASIGSGGTARTSHQMAWLTIGLGGVVVSGVGVAAWVLVGRRRIGRRRAVLLPDVAELILDIPSRESEFVGDAKARGVVFIPNGTHYHRAECPAVAAKQARTGAIADRTPCGICQPEEYRNEARR